MDEKEVKFKEAVAELVKDKSRRTELAELLIEYIEPNHLAVDMIGLLLNTRSMKPGDALVKKIRKGIKVHTHVPGSIPLKSEITLTDRINWVLDTAIVGVQANQWELDSGDLGTVESIRAECMAKLRDYYFAKVFTALSTVWTAANTPSNYATVATSITDTVLKAMINTINQTTSGVKAIVGTRSALTPITGFGTAWSYNGGTTYFPVNSQMEEVMKTGWLGTYYGAPIIALNQQWDNPEDHNALLPTNEILVIGNNVGEFITYGPERSKEWVDNEPTPPYWHMDIMSQFGLIIDKAEGIGRIYIS